MTEEELKEKYDRLINDEDFDRLDLGLKNPNIFEILRISKNEIRHSNFLSWLLDPNGSHKLGNIFLKRFLREVFSSSKFNDIDQIDVEGLNLSDIEIRREWKNIDILIHLENVIVCVENKVLSSEHSNQLSRYKSIIETEFPQHKQTFVYLNPEGISSIEESENYHPISYEFVIDSLTRIISIYGESMNTQVKNYIKDYITIIKRELMGTDKLTTLSQKIYKNHKELFDFIIDRKPEVLDNVRSLLNSLILDKGWSLASENKYSIRFNTPGTTPFVFINKSKNGLKNRESFAFEFYLSSTKNLISFFPVIAPCDENYDTSRLSDILQEISGFNKPIGKKWLVYKTHKERFPFDKLLELTEDEIIERLNKLLDKIIPIVIQVENKFEEYSEEIQSLNNE